MIQRGIPQYLNTLVTNYLSDRSVKVRGREHHPTKVGVPQSSILGPTLWNILYDDVLKLKLPEGTTTIGFADDLALLVEAPDRTVLEYNTNRSLLIINRWMTDNGLKLAPHKTEAILLRRQGRRDQTSFKLQDAVIKPQKVLKYLGITIDDQLTFTNHIENVTNKAEERIHCLARVLPNIGGPSSGKGAVLCGVAHSIILYGAPIWITGINYVKYRHTIIRVQRKMLLRVAHAYRTASAEALQVITGITPIDLLAEERAYVHKNQMQHPTLDDAKNQARANSLTTWQRRWDSLETKANWTRTLIPNVKIWLDCNFRNIEYYLTQILTGHGSSRSYTRRIGKDVTDACRYCGVCDTAEHTLFHCPRWIEERRVMETACGHHLTKENLIDIMIKSESTWRNIHESIKKIMKTKEEDERRLQALEAAGTVS